MRNRGRLPVLGDAGDDSRIHIAIIAWIEVFVVGGNYSAPGRGCPQAVFGLLTEP
jgi:hypothetical protein